MTDLSLQVVKQSLERFQERKENPNTIQYLVPNANLACEPVLSVLSSDLDLRLYCFSNTHEKAFMKLKQLKTTKELVKVCEIETCPYWIQAGTVRLAFEYQQRNIPYTVEYLMKQSTGAIERKHVEVEEANFQTTSTNVVSVPQYTRVESESLKQTRSFLKEMQQLHQIELERLQKVYQEHIQTLQTTVASLRKRKFEEEDEEEIPKKKRKEKQTKDPNRLYPDEEDEKLYRELLQNKGDKFLQHHTDYPHKAKETGTKLSCRYIRCSLYPRKKESGCKYRGRMFFEPHSEKVWRFKSGNHDDEVVH